MQVSLLQFLVILFLVLFLGMLAVNRWAPKNPWLRVLVGLPAGEPEAKPQGNVRIVMQRHGQGEVYIDGVKVQRCRSFEVSAEVGEINRLALVLNPEKIEIEGTYDVSVMNHDGSRVYEHFEAAPGHSGGGIGGPQPERYRGEVVDPSQVRGPQLVEGG